MSRIEKLLKAIINNTTYDEPRLSRIEEIFYSILNSLPYNANAQSRIEALLLALKESGLYDERTLSRIEEILKCKLDGRTYTGWIGSRVEMLLNEWELSEIIEATFTSFPIIIKANGEPLIDYLISGNMTQTGTPTSTTPIQPQECGERTGNLFDSGIEQGTISADGYINPEPTRIRTDSFIVLDAGTYTITADNDSLKSLYIFEFVYSLNDEFEERVPSTWTTLPYTFTLNAKKKVKFVFCWTTGGNITPSNILNIMLNTGSTALPYEPYGYKLDISSGGVNLAPPLTDWVDGYISSGNGGVHVPTETREKSSDFIRVEPNSVYVFSYENGNFPSGDSGAWRVAGLYDANKQFISRVGSANSLPLTITTTAETVYIRLSFRTYGGSENAMLNLGSTPLPYEPYNRTTTPVYLSEVESTRQIKKLVFTGGDDENWSEHTTNTFRINDMINDALCPADGNLGVSNAFVQTQYNNIGSMTDGQFTYGKPTGTYTRIAFKNTSCADVTAWKAYLQAQYAAGTPVTVWYVLATATTGIVNEPLMKIGDYADTVSMEQAGVEIPTVKGNTVIDVLTEVEPSEVDVTYRGSTKPKYNLFLAQNGDSFEAKDGQSLYIGGGL